MEQKQHFQNNNFWTNFHNNIKTSFDDIPERIEELKDMLENAILDYKFNRDPVRANKLMTKLDSQMELFFESLHSHQFDEKELSDLTELCRKINEDHLIEEIREKGIDENIPEEEVNVGTTKCVHVGNQTPDMEEPPFKKLVNRVETVIDEEQDICTSDKIEREIRKSPNKHKLNKGFEAEKQAGGHKEIEDIKQKEIDLEKKLIQEKHNEMLEKERQIMEQKRIEEAKQKQAEFETKQKELRDKKIAEIKENFLKMINQMLEEYHEHRLEAAYDCKSKIKEYIWHNNSQPELQEFFEEQLANHSRSMTEIDSWKREIEKVISDLDDNTNYIEDKGKKIYKLRYKLTPEGNAVLKMEGTLELPLFNILSLMYEADGFNHWVPFCKDAKLIKPLHRAAHAYWLRYSMPPPMSDRECHCFGIGVDRLDRNGSVLLISRKIHDDKNFLSHYNIEVPTKTKYVKMDIDVCIELVPISKTKVQIRVLTTVDPHVKNTPPAILSWISRKAAQHLFERLIKKAKNLKGTLWEKRIQERREFYGWLEGKVEKFMKEHSLA